MPPARVRYYILMTAPTEIMKIKFKFRKGKVVKLASYKIQIYIYYLMTFKYLRLKIIKYNF